MRNQALKTNKHAAFYFIALLIAVLIALPGGSGLLAQRPAKKQDSSPVNEGSAPAVARGAGATSEPAGEDPDEEKNAEEEKEESAKDDLKKGLTAPAPVLEIKRLEAEKPLYSIELRNVELNDLFRVIAHDYNLNIVVDSGVQGTVTASFTNISLEECLESIAELSNLILEKKGNILRVSQNLVTKVFVLKYVEAKKLIAAANATKEANKLSAASASSAAAGQSGQEGAVSAAPPVDKKESTVYDLLSDKGKLLLGQQPNSIVVIDYPAHMANIEAYFGTIDKKMTTKVFKLKYLKVEDVLGVKTTTQSTATTAASTTASGSSSASGSSTTTQ